MQDRIVSSVLVRQDHHWAGPKEEEVGYEVCFFI